MMYGDVLWYPTLPWTIRHVIHDYLHSIFRSYSKLHHRPAKTGVRQSISCKCLHVHATIPSASQRRKAPVPRRPIWQTWRDQRSADGPSKCEVKGHRIGLDELPCLNPILAATRGRSRGAGAENLPRIGQP